MGQQKVAHISIPLLLLLVMIHSSDSVSLQTDLSQSVEMFGESEGGSGEMTSSDEVTNNQTETNETEDSLSSSNELSDQQKQFFSNKTLSSTEQLRTLQSVSELQLFSEDNIEASPKANSSPINGTDDESEFIQQHSDQNSSSMLEFDHPLDINHTVDDSASFSNIYPSTPSHVAPQRYTADVSVNADNVSVTKEVKDNIYSRSDNDNIREHSSEQPLDEHSFNQLLNHGFQNNSDVNEIQDVNLENYNKSEIQSKAMNEPIEVPEDQSDSPAAQYHNNSFDSEEPFDKVFNISVNDTVDSEQNQYFNYQADSEERAEKSRVSNTQASGSDTEHITPDNNTNSNDIFELNNAFEVYHYPRKPETNVIDGVNQNKTLAQHIEELVLNRLPSLDKHKVNTIDSQHRSGDETGSENHEESDITFGVEISPHEIRETDDEETHSGSTLAFVFDSTGSMWDDLVQVKMGAERIMAAMLERPDKPIYNYVLVPFHDPSKLSQLYLLNSLLCNVHT